MKKNESFKVITLIGSAKFKEDFVKEMKKLTLQGSIVLMPVFDLPTESLDDDKIKMLKQLHFKRIEMADEIVVINKDGYIGDSTRAEIEHATKLGKSINYLYTYKG